MADIKEEIKDIGAGLKEEIKELKDKFLDLLKKGKKVGLALGGGAARGIAHVGVLKVLVKEGIPVHMIAGTSSGALFGALYAGGLGMEAMEISARRAGWSRLVRLAITRRGAVSGDSMVKLVEEAIGHKEFKDLKIPFTAVASDLKSGERVVISEGSVAEAVHASSAIPGVFIPVHLQGRLLADGMITENVPVAVVKSMGADFIIAVDVLPKVSLDKEPGNMVEVVERALDIGVRVASEKMIEKADVWLDPVRQSISPFALNHADDLIKMGERAATDAIPEIKKKLGI